MRGAVSDGTATRRRDFFGLLLLLSCVMIWGANAVAFKVGTHPATGVGFDPVLMNGLRFLLVAPLLLVFIAVRDPSALRVPNRADLVRFAIYGLFSIVISETLLTVALTYTSVANMTLLGPGTMPLFTALWAAVLDKQKLSRAGVVGALVAMAGVGIVAGAGGNLHLSGTSLIGDGISLARSVVQGLYMIYLNRSLRANNPFTVTIYNVLFGTLWFLPYVAWKAPSFAWGDVSWQVWAALGWTVLPTSVYGFLVWNTVMPRVGPVAATNVFYLLPLFGALSAWVVLGEPLTFAQMTGGAVIIAGLIVLRWETLVAAGIVPGRRQIIGE
ncbi:MAG: DMT family transporter [Akkermansiaceae bacterium]|nr:DMT family transporter [Armatimonadota bacterium]